MSKSSKKTLIKIISFSVILTVLGTTMLFAGGSSDRGNSGPVITTGMEPISEYPISDGTKKLTVWAPLNPSLAKLVSNYNDAPVMQELERRTGVEIEFIHPALGIEQEHFNLMLTSGDLPDIIIHPAYYIGGEFQGMNDGFFMDLSEYIPVYAPDYYELIENDIAFTREVSDEQGRIPVIATYKPEGDPMWHYMLFQQEVLDEIGAEVPLYIEDYEVLFEEMKAIGITPYMPPKNGYEGALMDIFGVSLGGSNDIDVTVKMYKDENNNIHYAPLEDGFRDYLELMNSWYEKGYISRDFASTESSQARIMFDTMQVGVMRDACVGAYNRNELLGQTVTVAPMPRLYEDQPLHGNFAFISPAQNLVSSKAAISKDCNDVETALRWLNYLFTEEGIELSNWGIEGINFTNENGQNTYTDIMLNNPNFGTEEASYYYKLHIWPKYNHFDVEVHANLLKSPGALEIRTRYANDKNYDNAYLLPNIRLTDEELDERADILSDANTYIDEMTLKFITGAESFSNYDDFLATIERFDVQSAIDITQNALDRYLKLGL